MSKNLPFLFTVSLISCCIEVDIVIPSFLSISNYFNISYGLTQMIIAANCLSFCISSLVYGPLSDFYGRRKVMIIGNAIMLIGACGCVIVPSIELLLFSSFIQGIGASTSAVVVFAMIADVYPREKAAKLIGTMNSFMAIFMSLAPIIGGFINELVGWRGNYFVIAIISLISWLLLYFNLPETKQNIDKFNINKILKDYKLLLTDKSFIYSSVIPSLSYSGYISFVACGSFLYMKTYNLSMMYYVLHQGVIILIFSAVSMYAGQINNLVGQKKCIIVGIALLFLGSIMMLIVGLVAKQAVYLTTFSMIIFLMGEAISYPIIFTKSLEIFPAIKGTASSAIMGMRSLMCAAFMAFTSYLYDGTLLMIALVVSLSGILMVICTLKLLKLISFTTKKYKYNGTHNLDTQ